MKANLNFLFAVLVVIAIVSVALMTRGCGGPSIPACFEKSVTLEAAVAKSSASGKPVLALVSEDGSEACRDLKRGAMANPKVVEWIKANTEPVYIDLTRATGRSAESQRVRDLLHVNVLPSIVILERGLYAGHLEGDVGTKALLDWLGRVKEDLDKERETR